MLQHCHTSTNMISRFYLLFDGKLNICWSGGWLVWHLTLELSIIKILATAGSLWDVDICQILPRSSSLSRWKAAVNMLKEGKKSTDWSSRSSHTAAGREQGGGRGRQGGICVDTVTHCWSWGWHGPRRRQVHPHPTRRCWAKKLKNCWKKNKKASTEDYCGVTSSPLKHQCLFSHTAAP